MDSVLPWLGDLYDLPGASREWVGLICILASVLAGAVIGIERERRDKPAGLRTVMLIALGSTIFTLVSLLLAERKEMADPARLASQIIPGIGFLGAGAIIRSRGTVIGLTTGATIWTVAAIGVTIGAGYVVAGLFFTSIIAIALTGLNRIEGMVAGPCVEKNVRVSFRPQRGKTRVCILEILDQYKVPDHGVEMREVGPDDWEMKTRICVRHREHRAILADLVKLPDVSGISGNET